MKIFGVVFSLAGLIIISSPEVYRLYVLHLDKEILYGGNVVTQNNQDKINKYKIFSGFYERYNFLGFGIIASVLGTIILSN